MRGLELVRWSEGQWEANEDISTNHESLNELISDGGDCRTAPATPGLLNISFSGIYKDSKPSESCVLVTF